MESFWASHTISYVCATTSWSFTVFQGKRRMSKKNYKYTNVQYMIRCWNTINTNIFTYHASAQVYTCNKHSTFILFIGCCTEYSQTGNLIQQSFRANCSLFSQNPCPNTYNSTEAYKCK